MAYFILFLFVAYVVPLFFIKSAWRFASHTHRDSPGAATSNTELPSRSIAPRTKPSAFASSTNSLI